MEQEAVEKFNNGCNCAQSVLSVFAKDLKLAETDAFRIAAGFGGGMGRLQNTCGAVTGAFMVIGLRAGLEAGNVEEIKETTERKVKEFNVEFKKKHGSTLCRDLVGVDFSTDEGTANFRERGLKEKVCSVCVRDAVSILKQV